jgi:hypothetical protein
MLLTPQAPTPPATPAPPAPPAPVISGTPTAAQGSNFITFRVPRTADEVANLRAQRNELSNQIENVRGRRSSLARAYERADGASKDGLEQQLRIVDQRLTQMEADLAESGRALTNSPALTTSTGVPFQFLNLGPGQVTAVSILFVLFVLGPLAGSFGRLIWRRSSKPSTPPGWNEAANRLERLEQAVDTIAVEMERVSEGQRFLTKIMTQRGASGGAGETASPGAQGLNGGEPLPALGPGAPEPIVMQNQRDEVRVRRS